MVLVIILPTGNVAGLNIKLLFMLVITSFVLYDIVINDMTDAIAGSIKYVSSISVVLLAWVIIGLLKNDAYEFYGFSQFKDFMATIIVTWLGYYLYRRRLLDWYYYFRLVLYAHLTYIMLKVAMFTAVFLNYITLTNLVDFIRNVFGYSLVTFNFSGNIIESNVVRLDLLNDSLSPYLLLFLLNTEQLGIRIKPNSKFFMIILLIVNILIGYKRSLIIVGLFVLLYSIFFAMKSSTRLKALIVVSAIVAVLYINYSEEINYFVVDRFSSSSQDYSDTLRLEQFHVLMNEFYDNYLIGKGMGGYAYNYIRSEDLPYSYEMQWMQFLMQFGILGIIIVILTYCTIIIPAIRNWFRVDAKIRIIVLISFVSWGLISFTNPMMLSSFCSAFYTLILLTALKYCSPTDAI